MRHAMTGIGLGAALTLSCLAGATGAAHADSAESSRLYAPSSLVLIIGKGTDATSSAVQRAVLLRCAPTPGGDHPSPAQACADLNAAQGDFNALAAATDPTKFCPMLWDPVVITAVGVWQGDPVSYTREYPNQCIMHNHTGRVFAF